MPRGGSRGGSLPPFRRRRPIPASPAPRARKTRHRRSPRTGPVANVVAEAGLWRVRGSTHRRNLRDGYIVVSPDPDEPAKDDGTPWWQWKAFKADGTGRTIPAARQRYFRTAADARLHAGAAAGDQIVTRYAAASSPEDAIDRVGRSLTSRDPFAAPGVALHPDDIPARERGRHDVYRVRFGTCFTATGPALVQEASRAAGRSPESPAPQTQPGPGMHPARAPGAALPPAREPGPGPGL
jgi:hypothetical protein